MPSWSPGAIGLGVAGGALAYFTSTGSGTGNATVGTATAWTVSVDCTTGGLLTPGVGTDTVAYTVTNAEHWLPGAERHDRGADD